MPRRLATLLASGAFALLATLAIASPAAAVTPAQGSPCCPAGPRPARPATTRGTAPGSTGQPGPTYNFNWSTDYCSSSPDNPLGFTFNLGCYRHDFGYRNYKAVGQFSANKSRLDSAFYEDLKRVCATYNSVVRPACYSLAWTYYQAVSIFGSVAAVQQADIDRAARMKAEAEANAAAR